MTACSIRSAQPGTGGFGIKNSSVAYYNSAYIDYVIGIFMMLFGLNFNVYFLIIARKFSQIKSNDEVKWYIGMMIGATVIIALNIMPMYHGFGRAFRYSFFQVSSIMTTTGYSTADFVRWPMLSQIILVLLMVVGACAGSTSGGMKVTRFIILMKTATHSIKKAVSPRSVFSVKVDGKTVEKNIVNGVLGYFVVYMLFAAVSILLISFDNKDFTTTVTAVIATMNNIGPGLGLVGSDRKFCRFLGIVKNSDVNRYACRQT